MTPMFCTVGAALALSFAAQAGAQELWINSDSASRENRLGSVVLLELGSAPGCMFCRAASVPGVAALDVVRRAREPDFHESIARRRAENKRQHPLRVESGKPKGPPYENSQHNADTPHL
jgi:hypothetical protein